MSPDFDQYPDIDRSNFVRYNPAFQKIVFGQSDLLPFWVADTDFKVMPELIDALSNRAKTGYLPYETKSPHLKEILTAWYKERYEIQLHAKRLLFVPSVNTSVALITELFSKEGEGVIIQPPVYQAFAETITNLNRKVVTNPLKLTNQGYVIDFEDFENKATDPNSKIFLLCHPHNPVGRVWNYEELNQLAEICHRNGVLIITDEIHGDVVYAPNKYIGMLEVTKQYSDNIIMITSAGKSFGITGLLDSFIFTPNTDHYKKLRHRIESLHIDKSNAFTNVAWESIYSHGKDWLEHMSSYLYQNIKMLDEMINKNIEGASFIKPEGTYQIWLDFRKLNLPKEALTRFIVDQAGLGMNAGYTYGVGGEGFMRMNIASPKKLLEQGIEQLASAISNNR